MMRRKVLPGDLVKLRSKEPRELRTSYRWTLDMTSPGKIRTDQLAVVIARKRTTSGFFLYSSSAAFVITSACEAGWIGLNDLTRVNTGDRWP